MAGIVEGGSERGWVGVAQGLGVLESSWKPPSSTPVSGMPCRHLDPQEGARLQISHPKWKQTPSLKGMLSQVLGAVSRGPWCCPSCR